MTDLYFGTADSDFEILPGPVEIFYRTKIHFHLNRISYAELQTVNVRCSGVVNKANTIFDPTQPTVRTVNSSEQISEHPNS